MTRFGVAHLGVGKHRSVSKNISFFDRAYLVLVPPIRWIGTDGRGRDGLLSVGNQEEKVDSGGLLRTPMEWQLAETEGFEPSVPFAQYDGLANRWFQPLTHVSACASSARRLARQVAA